MVAPSKLFQPPLNCIHCSQLLEHYHPSCGRVFLRNLYRYNYTSLKYFLPLVITPFLLKFKTLDRQALLDIIKYYLETSLWPGVGAALSFSIICFLRACLGKFQRFTVGFIPIFLGMQLAWFFPKRCIRLFSIGTSQATFETLLRQGIVPFSNVILNSSLAQTLLFMFSGAIILHYKNLKKYNGFWFVQPHNHTTSKQFKDEHSEAVVSPPPLNPNRCNGIHSGITCQQFILDGLKSFLLYGIPLDLLNMIMKGKVPPNTKGITNICFTKIKSLRFKMTSFFLSYVGIYRLSSCLLSKYANIQSSSLQHFITAFLGGTSYLCLNKVTFCSLSIIVAIQVLWQQFCNENRSENTEKIQNSCILDVLKKVPFGRLVVPFNVAYLVHCYVFDYHAVNSLARGFINGITDNQLTKVHAFLGRNDYEALMKMSAVC